VGVGLLSFRLTWQNAGDLDLSVTPPSPCGQKIDYNLLIACGAELDKDDTQGTGPENIFWAASPARGSYLYCVNPYKPASAGPFTLVITEGTKVTTINESTTPGNAYCGTYVVA
jgi:uncharacterized protein YfaP (DUF2135 family)